MRRAGSARPEADQRRPHPLAWPPLTALSGRPTMVKVRHAGRHLHLHVDGAGLDALERNSGDPLDHAPPLLGNESNPTGGSRAIMELTNPNRVVK